MTKPRSIPRTAVAVFTLDPAKMQDDPHAEMSAWVVNEYEDTLGGPTLEAEITDAYADFEAKLEELFGKGMVACTLFDEDDLEHMVKRYRKPRSFLARLLRSGRP